MPPIAEVRLDHVALAVERWADAWPRYAVDLGGFWVSGGLNVGFGPAQLRFANAARVEILQPWQPEDNPFLRRFLDRHGPGPHHLTFKVPDLSSAIESARRAGFSPIGIDLSHDDWKEAFLHPHDASGVVVQLAQAAHGWDSPPPEGFPQARRARPASLVRVVHAVADLDMALALFTGLLGGVAGPPVDGAEGTWTSVDVAWPDPPVLRLVASTRPDGGGGDPVGSWLTGLTGRVHHLAFAMSGAGEKKDALSIPGVAAGDDARAVIEPVDNLGTRLVLLEEPG